MRTALMHLRAEESRKLTQVGPSRVPAAGIVILVPNALERCGLVDRHAGAAMLILVVPVWRIYSGTESGEAIGLPGSSQGRRIGLGGWEVIGGRLLRGAGRGHGVERRRGWMKEGMERRLYVCRPDERGGRRASFWLLGRQSQSGHSQYPHITCSTTCNDRAMSLGAHNQACFTVCGQVLCSSFEPSFRVLGKRVSLLESESRQHTDY